MVRRLSIPLTFATGVLCMLCALTVSLVTFVSDGDYVVAFFLAALFSTLSFVSFRVPIRRGSKAWSICARIAALPLAFVIADWLRRAPYLFGLM